MREMPFLEHLVELRSVITASVVLFLGLAIGYWCFTGPILEWIVKAAPVEHLVFNAPAEAFMVRNKLSLILGGLTAFPYIVYRVWRFVMPGLFRRERRKVMPIAVWSMFLFYAGVIFCYFVMIPGVVRFLIGYGTAHVQPLITVGAYFDTVSQLCLVMGLVFQLPIVMFLLSAAGLVPASLFMRQWRFAIVIIFIVSAIATPPDVLSQALMAIPLCILYIGSALTALIVSRRREKKNAMEAT